jgi:hypothetical protein
VDFAIGEYSAMDKVGKLSGLQKRILRDAILETFDRDDLALMVSDRLDTRLDVIVGSRRFDREVFDLIEWAGRRAKLDQLIGGVTAERPHLATTLAFWAAPPATCPCRKPYPAWQSIENRTMIACNEGSLQAHWLDGCGSDSVAGNA